MHINYISRCELDTYKLANLISKYLKVGDILTLTGDLGAGKTTFTKGIAKGLNVKEEVNSPTFNILKCYFSGDLNLYHIDAYRLEDLESYSKNVGLEEVIEGDGVCLIEWPDFISEFIPDNILEIKITINEGIRNFEFSTNSSQYDELMNKISEFIKE